MSKEQLKKEFKTVEIKINELLEDDTLPIEVKNALDGFKTILEDTVAEPPSWMEDYHLGVCPNCLATFSPVEYFEYSAPGSLKEITKENVDDFKNVSDKDIDNEDPELAEVVRLGRALGDNIPTDRICCHECQTRQLKELKEKQDV